METLTSVQNKGKVYDGHQWPLPKSPWLEQRASDWMQRRDWLRSMGMSDRTIRVYRLDRYPYMTYLAWECMVREAMRSNITLAMEQRRRKSHAPTRSSVK